jgi:hypothetical protein
MEQSPREKLVANFPELGETPSTIRAFVHLISNEELESMFGKLSIKKELDIRDDLKISDNNFFSSILKYLKTKDKKSLKLTRGDLIYLELELGYRNKGKYIFNGKEIMDLNFEVDDNGNVPMEFQVITEFPIHYWDGRISHNTLVPFDFKGILGKLIVMDVKRQTRFPYVSFIQDGETYIIAADIDKNLVVSNADFLGICLSSKYFNWAPTHDEHFRTSNLANILYVPI